MNPENSILTDNLTNHRPFFIPGGTLPSDALSYVTRRADHDLLEGLRAGRFCYVLTSRQMGKSSLMVRIAGQLRAEGVGVALLDLTALGQNLSVEQWYFGLLEQLGRHLRMEDALEDYWLAHKSLGPLQRWMGALRDVALAQRERRIVLFVDEIDITRSLPFSTDEFFAAIRECYNRRAQEPQFERLTFCLLGVASPSDLIRDTTMTPFNIGRRIELTDFTPTEAELLSVGINVMGRDGHGLLRRVHYWTGGHPYLTQRLCVAVVEDPTALREEDVDRLCADLFLTHRAQESDDNLQFVRNRLLRNEGDLTALLELYAQVRQGGRVLDEEANALTSVLKLSGIVRLEDGKLKVRNRIYERVFDRSWVQTHLPGAELRRQRAAYRRGVVRALALSSMVLLALFGLTTYGFVQAHRAAHSEKMARLATMQAQAQFAAAEQASYVSQMNLIQRDWEINDVRDAILLLSRVQDSPYRGFEWGYWNRLSHLERMNLTGQVGAFSPDGKRIVTGSDSNTAWIWDTSTKRPALTLRGHSGAITSVAFSPDGRTIVTGSKDNTAKIWDASTGQEKLTLTGHTRYITSVAFSPDGKRIVTGSNDRTAKVWDASTGQERLTFKGHAATITSAAFSPNGQDIVTGSYDNTAKVWEASTGRVKLLLKGHDEPVTSVAFSPDGRQIVTGSDDNTAKVWNAFTGQATLTLKGQQGSIAPEIVAYRGRAGGIRSVVFSPDGKHIVVGTGTLTQVLDAGSGQEIFTLKGENTPVTSVAFSPDGKQIFTGTEHSAGQIWAADAGQEALTLAGHTNAVTAIAFSRDGKQLATSSADRTVTVRDASGQERLTLAGHTGAVTSIAFSPDGKRIVTGSEDRTAKVWDAGTGRELLTFTGHKNTVNAVTFSPNGKQVVTTGDYTIQFWDPATGQVSRTFLANRVQSLAFSPDGMLLVTGSEDRTVKIWDTVTGQEMHLLLGHTSGVTSVAFSPDGRHVVTGSTDNTAKLWDVGSGHEVCTLTGHSNWVESVAFSPDGKRIVTGSADHVVKLWDTDNGQEILTLKGHSGDVNAVAFSPNGKRIVTGSADHTIKIWFSDAIDYRKMQEQRAAH